MSKIIKLKVAELFAGVGGFRLGLESAGHETVWANQWEPKTKVQHAYDCYVKNFGDFENLNKDINKIDEKWIPDHDLLVGGFPCQDYSVATVSAKGIKGKKGVLWWDIHRIITEKEPQLILLENVDRLLNSPVPQRGRDFAVMLGCLRDNGYVVEWRVINAGDYGLPQKRRRVFIFGAKEDSDWGKHLNDKHDSDYLVDNGFFSTEFPSEHIDNSLFGNLIEYQLDKNLEEISKNFSSKFFNAGFMVGSSIFTSKVSPIKTDVSSLKDILIKGVNEKYYIPDEDYKKWKYLKGAKKKVKIKDGAEIKWSEGAIPFPEDLEQPARTVLTNEGGLGPSRFKHLVEDPWTKKFRILTPEEVEKIFCFPEGHTKGIPDNWRYFCMGNALVVGLIEKMGRQLRNGPK